MCGAICWQSGRVCENWMGMRNAQWVWFVSVSVRGKLTVGNMQVLHHRSMSEGQIDATKKCEQVDSRTYGRVIGVEGVEQDGEGVRW